MARFDCATWRPISVNTSGHLAPNLGLVLHHAVANGSLYGFFNTAAAEVSAHFWVSQSGLIEQYVDSDTIAWHGRQLNNRYCGVETEGCSAPPHADPMSEAMIDALARLYHEGNARHGWPFIPANTDGEAGFGFHRMAVNTACPCDIRLNMRPEILERAQGVEGGAPAPTPPPPAQGAVAGVPPWPGRYLSYPPVMQGTDVTQWQQQMAKRGWTIGVDGQYGPQSKQVCTSFQGEKGLGVDGIVGPDTWAAAWTSPVT